MLSLAIREPVFRLTFRYTVQSLAIAPLIHLAVVRADHPVYRWLNTRPLILLGKLSYSVYLSHQVMFYLVTASWPQLSWLSSTLLASVATLLVAAALLHWVERPCAVLRRRLHRNWRGRASSPPGNATVTAP
jgi:peptidoglycan/LPS O-acetylase OafA/YrhL